MWPCKVLFLEGKQWKHVLNIRDFVVSNCGCVNIGSDYGSMPSRYDTRYEIGYEIRYERLFKKYETSNERSKLSLTIHFKYRRKYIESVGFHLVWILVTGVYSIEIFQWTNWKFVVNVNVRKYEYFSWYPTAGQSHYSYRKYFHIIKCLPDRRAALDRYQPDVGRYIGPISKRYQNDIFISGLPI